MSEYGCITNTRTFAETAALYQTDMTGVFSGGLVYEYSEDGNGFGIVTISGNTVTPVASQFSDLMQELSSTPDPSGDGGYSTSGVVQTCPAQGANWDTSPFTGSALPATPSGAAKYFQQGAGTGPGLSGDGSQDAGGGSSATASANAGSVTATYTATSAASSGASSAMSTGSGSASSAGAASSASSSKAAAAGRNVHMGVGPWVCGIVVASGIGLGAVLI